MAVPYTFGTATAAIPLSQLDSNFATAITIGNTAVQLGNTVTTLNNITLANVTISSGTVTLTNVAVTTANVSGTANISTLVVVGNETVGGNITITGNITATGTATAAKLIPTGTSVTGNGVFLPTTDTLGFSTAGAEQMRISSSVNGIVTVGPRAASVGGFGTDYATVGVWNSVGGGYRIYRGTGAGTAVAQFYGDGTSVNLFALEASTPLIFGTAGAEKARIDSSGNLLAGVTSSSSNGGGVMLLAASGAANGGKVQVNKSAAGTATIFAGNYYGQVGSITMSDSALAFNTTSDYRLKENVSPMTGALDKVSQLNPVTYTWKRNGFAGQGFIAHELQAVIPDSVIGEKDAVDDEGNPEFQQVDYSKLVATLTSAIKEQQALITQLQADVAALKGA